MMNPWIFYLRECDDIRQQLVEAVVMVSLMIPPYIIVKKMVTPQRTSKFMTLWSKSIRSGPRECHKLASKL